MAKIHHISSDFDFERRLLYASCGCQSSDFLARFLTVRHRMVWQHCFICLKMVESENRTYYINFNKTNSSGFKDYTEANFTRLIQYELPTNVYKLERIFRSVLNKASKLFVPTGNSYNQTRFSFECCLSRKRQERAFPLKIPVTRTSSHSTKNVRVNAPSRLL